MRKPLKKYFTPASGCMSLMMIRRWLADGATCVRIAEWISREYAVARSDKARRHLGLILSSVFDSGLNRQTEEIAKECAGRFGVPEGNGRCISENAFAEMTGLYGDGQLQWLDTFNPYLDRCGSQYRLGEVPSGLSRFFGSGDGDVLFPLMERLSLYAVRNADGRFSLVIFNGCSESAIVDEEPFGGEPPLYFTERSHFVSPVWILKQAAVVLEYLLRRVGYPQMRIFRTVMFRSGGISILNYDDFRESDYWKDVELVFARDLGDRCLFPAPLHAAGLACEDGKPRDDMDAVFMRCLIAAAEILNSFNVVGSMVITDGLLETWCERLCIFGQPPHDGTD